MKVWLLETYDHGEYEGPMALTTSRKLARLWEEMGEDYSAAQMEINSFVAIRKEHRNKGMYTRTFSSAFMDALKDLRKGR